MINLLPENEKANLDREYTYRHAFIALSAAVLLVVVAIIAMLPTFVLSFFKSRATVLPMNTTDPDINKTQEAFKKQLTDAKLYMQVLRPSASTTAATHIIELLEKNRTSENTIKSIDYTVSETGVNVTVNGIAKTRQSLSTFTDKLRKEQGIASVDVPVSNFTKDSNIPYIFSLTTK
jgi:hypothetical protein